MKKLLASFALILSASGLVMAQVAAEPPVAPQPPETPSQASTPPRPGYMRMRRPEMDMGGPGMGMRGPEAGKWWKNPELAQKLGLTDDQISKMEKIFQDHRLQLIDLHAALDKQEVILEPMIEAEHPDEDQVLAQIDKVAEARANLEKSNARMLFAIRDTLTPDQWKKLQTMRSEMRRPVRMEYRGFRRQEHGFRTGGRIGSGPAPATAAPPAPPPPPNP